MQTKTKRGPRRTRNQRVINKRFIVTNYAGCRYIKAGKPYAIRSISDIGLLRINSEIGKAMCSPVGYPCAHLLGGTWRYLTK